MASLCGIKGPGRSCVMNFIFQAPVSLLFLEKYYMVSEKLALLLGLVYLVSIWVIG